MARCCDTSACRRIDFPGYDSHAIAFDDVVRDDENMASLLYSGGGTDIIAPFAHLERLVAANVKAKVTVVLFVTDGVDSEMSSYSARKQKLASLAKQASEEGRLMVFLCVGVRSNFPTNIALELKPLFNNGGLYLPFILKIDSAADVDPVFKELYKIIYTRDLTKGHEPSYTLEAPLEQLADYAEEMFQYAVNMTATEEDINVSKEIYKETKERLMGITTRAEALTAAMLSNGDVNGDAEGDGTRSMT